MSVDRAASQWRTPRLHKVYFALKILVTFALETEFAPWRTLRKFRRSMWGAVEVHSAEIGESEVDVVLTGVGSRQAALAVSKLSWGEADGMQFCISSGLAGALKTDYRIGQVLAARTVTAERAPEEGTDSVAECSPALVSFAAECGATVVDRFYSAERAIVAAHEKRHLGERADAVEMESFQVLFKSRTDGIPAVAIRSISDTADEDLPLDMNEVFNESGEVSIPRVLGQVAMHPQSLPGLVRLGRKSKHAAESLAEFLDRYILAFTERASILESRRIAALGQAGQ
jgi:nucleoside phosphorylase